MRSVLLICTCFLAGCSAVGQNQPGGSTPAVAAVVAGEIITTDAVVKHAGVPLIQAEQDAHQKKVAALDQLIQQKLVALESGRRGITAEELTQAEITSKVAAVTDAEVAEFYEANKHRLNGSEEEAREQIRTFLQTDRLRTRQQTFIQELRTRTPVEIRLEPPPLPALDISIAGASLRGNPDAPVTIVEFADFHCAFCRQALPTLDQIFQKYGSQVKMAFKHLPIDDLHPGVTRVHEASQCATEQGKFWEYYTALYSSDPFRDDARLQELAQQLGLDSDAFAACLNGEQSRNTVQKDVDEAKRLGLGFTPAFFINGRMIAGAQPLESFVRIIDQELK